MTTVAMILDGILAAVVVLCIALGIKRGFVKSIVRMIGSVASLVVSFLVSGPIAQALFSSLFRDSVHGMVTEAIGADAAAAVSSLQGQWESVFTRLPELFRNGLSASGVNSPAQLSDAVAASGAATAGDAANVLVDQLIAPVCVMLLQILVFIVLFIAVSIVVKFAAAALDKVFSSLPIIRNVNSALGAVTGLLQGAVLALVLCAGLQMYMTAAGAQCFVTPADLESTWLTGWLMDVNPLF